MTDFLAKANSLPMYLMAIVIVGAVLLQSVVFLVRALREGKRLGMDMCLLKRIVKSSASFSFVPSVAILIGVLALAPALGVPLPWIRLSVVGALHYEGSTANNIAKGLGLGELPSTLISGGDFAAIAFAMVVGVIWSGLFVLLFYRRYQKKISTVSSGDPKFANILFCAMFVGMVSAYVGDAFSKLRSMTLSSGELRSPNVLYLIAMLVSCLAMALFDRLIEKKNIRWLESYSYSFAMILGMAGAVVGQFIFPSLSVFTE